VMDVLEDTTAEFLWKWEARDLKAAPKAIKPAATALKKRLVEVYSPGLHSCSALYLIDGVQRPFSEMIKLFWRGAGSEQAQCIEKRLQSAVSSIDRQGRQAAGRCACKGSKSAALC